jgi:hypothetical protein
MSEVGPKRRDFIAGTLAVAGAMTFPVRAFATTSTILPEQRKLVDIARQQVERVGDRLWRRDKVGLVDFGLPSTAPRLFVVDMVGGTIKSHLVAHGRGSDPEHDGWLKYFSNQQGSEATSRGAYLTMDWYKGKYGSSMRLEGLDRDNDMAMDRAIVLHEAWYAAPDMIDKWGKLGRSEGCFAVSPGLNKEMLYHLGGGRLIYADKF